MYRKVLVNLQIVILSQKYHKRGKYVSEQNIWLRMELIWGLPFFVCFMKKLLIISYQFKNHVCKLIFQLSYQLAEHRPFLLKFKGALPLILILYHNWNH